LFARPCMCVCVCVRMYACVCECRACAACIGNARTASSGLHLMSAPTKGMLARAGPCLWVNGKRPAAPLVYRDGVVRRQVVLQAEQVQRACHRPRLCVVQCCASAQDSPVKQATLKAMTSSPATATPRALYLASCKGTVARPLRVPFDHQAHRTPQFCLIHHLWQATDVPMSDLDWVPQRGRQPEALGARDLGRGAARRPGAQRLGPVAGGGGWRSIKDGAGGQ
jgi:hypothetical protein